MTPGQRAQADQMMENAVRRTVALAEDVQGLDEIDASVQMADKLLNAHDMSRRALAMALSVMAIRLYRREQAGGPAQA